VEEVFLGLLRGFPHSAQRNERAKASHPWDRRELVLPMSGFQTPNPGLPMSVIEECRQTLQDWKGYSTYEDSSNATHPREAGVHTDCLLDTDIRPYIPSTYLAETPQQFGMVTLQKRASMIPIRHPY
jgi:hypothetical protein